MAIEVAPEAARPIHCVEEADDDAAMDLLFDALEAGPAAEKLVEPVILLVNVRGMDGVKVRSGGDLLQALVVADDVVMGEDHEHARERNAQLDRKSVV